VANRTCALLLSFLLCLSLSLDASAFENRSGKAQIVFFWGDGCPHCAAEEDFLAPILEANSRIELVSYEVWYNTSNAQIFNELSRRYGTEPRGVPTTIIGDKVWVGFDERKGEEMRSKIESCLTKECEDPMARLQRAPSDYPASTESDETDRVQTNKNTSDSPWRSISDPSIVESAKRKLNDLRNPGPFSHLALAILLALLAAIIIAQLTLARKNRK